MHKSRIIPVILFLIVICVLSSCGGSLGKQDIPEEIVSVLETESSITEEPTVQNNEAVLTKTDVNKEKKAEEYLEILVSDNKVLQGGYIILKSKDIKSGYTYFDFYGRVHIFQSFNNESYSIIPIACYDEPGSYTLSFNYEGDIYSVDIEVLKDEYETQYLEISSSVASQTLLNQEAKIAFYNTSKKYLDMERSPIKADDTFIIPIKNEYRITTTYGTFRTFSDGSTEYHEALDMAAKKGTPVYATNNGKVLFAQELQYTGNTVIIDHGFGILSWYFHLDSFSVNEGEYITRGLHFAKVGTTGLSTGNHLHFGISIDGIFVNPNTVINGIEEFNASMEGSR